MEILRARLGELERQRSLNYDTIDSIRTEFDHSIELVEGWSDPGSVNFNCVMYALDLRNDQLLNALANSWDIIKGTPGRDDDRLILADTEFLEFCIAEGAMPPISDCQICAGNLLVYKNERKCRHIGKLVNHGRIHSKWGTKDLLEHDPLEVQDRYGDDLQYVESLSRKQSRDLFIKYAWSVVDDDPQVKIRLEHTIKNYR